MDFGIFLEQTRRGTGQADAFLEMFELVDAAEAWGLDIVWLAEMLINPARSVLSAPFWSRAGSPPGPDTCAWAPPCSSCP